MEGAAAMVFGLSFFGFLASRLLRRSPLAIVGTPDEGGSLIFVAPHVKTDTKNRAAAQAGRFA
jgi:hypothetical protein